MLASPVEDRCTTNRTVGLVVAVAMFLAVHTVSATTYMSVEPIPNRDVIGEENLASLRSIGYGNLERWSQRLLSECLAVENVITRCPRMEPSRRSRPPTPVRRRGWRIRGRDQPLLCVHGSGSGRRLGERGRCQRPQQRPRLRTKSGRHGAFQPGNARAYAFVLDYAVVTFLGTLAGEEAREFFDCLGTIDAALWRGLFAGFTQIDFGNSSTNNSMLFLQPAVSKERFISGLSTAADDNRRATTPHSRTTRLPPRQEPASPFPAMTGSRFQTGSSTREYRRDGSTAE